MIQARLLIDTGKKSIASSLVNAIRPDNANMQGLKIRGRTEGSNAIIDIVFDGKIETFISTLDDLLQCIQAAKDTITKINE